MSVIKDEVYIRSALYASLKKVVVAMHKCERPIQIFILE